MHVHAARGMWHAACGMGHVAWGMGTWHAVRGTWHGHRADPCARGCTAPAPQAAPRAKLSEEEAELHRKTAPQLRLMLEYMGADFDKK